MSTQPVEDLDATVTDGGDLLVPAGEVSRIVDVEPGDHLRVRILDRTHRRRNMYGIFADDPIGISDGDLGESVATCGVTSDPTTWGERRYRGRRRHAHTLVWYIPRPVALRIAFPVTAFKVALEADAPTMPTSATA